MNMVEEEVDLGLSLGVGGASEFHRKPRLPPSQLKQLPLPASPPSNSPLLATRQRAPAAGPQCCGFHVSSSFSEGRRGLTRGPFLNGIDVNRAPVLTDAREPNEEHQEEDGVSSPDSSTVSSAVTGGGAGGNNRADSGHPPNSSVGDENELERVFSRVISDEEDGGEGSRNKKLRLSKEQAAVLEENFKEHHTLNPRQKLALAKQLQLRPRQVEVWFQNRRARTKLKQTEVDCELLRRCCDGLTEENRRLQRELRELRALKLLSPQHYRNMAPPTTLTVCPSCERFGAISSAPSSSTTASSIPPLAVAGGHDRLQQFPPQRLRHHVFTPHHLLQGRPIPVASAGRSLPWEPPAPLRAASYADAPPPR